MNISVVIPVFNEEGNVKLLHSSITKVLKSMKTSYEIIFVDDGSTDGTFKQLAKLKKVKVVKLRKNFGQTAAMAAGFRAATGKIIISMDGDLQNDPSDIPRLVAHMKKGYDVVCGWRADRKDTFSKRFFSKIANFLRRKLINDQIHDSGCSLKAYRKECFEDIDLLGEMHRYLPALLGWKGYKIGEIKVKHHQRHSGTTKYGFGRIINGFLDLINVWFWRKYSARPLHIFGGAGVILSGIGGFLGFALLVARQLFGYKLGQSQLPLLAVLLFIVGIQLFISGLMADISIKTYYGHKNKRSYTIEKIVKK